MKLVFLGSWFTINGHLWLMIPIHRHPDKDESFVILRGKVRSTTYNDDGSIIESVVLCAEDGVYGVDIPKNVWHKLEAIESSVIFECKQGHISTLTITITLTSFNAN